MNFPFGQSPQKKSARFGSLREMDNTDSHGSFRDSPRLGSGVPMRGESTQQVFSLRLTLESHLPSRLGPGFRLRRTRATRKSRDSMTANSWLRSLRRNEMSCAEAIPAAMILLVRFSCCGSHAANGRGLSRRGLGHPVNGVAANGCMTEKLPDREDGHRFLPADGLHQRAGDVSR
jgi:hypothetical protein